MAGNIQEAIHPEVGCGRPCIIVACCPFLYVAEPMDKFQAKFHFEERGCVDKFVIDLAVVCFCLPCELTREWRQIENYQNWVNEGGLEMVAQEENKGVYDQTAAPVAPNPYANQAAPNPYANQAAPNPYANQPAPNPYANQAPPNPYADQGQPQPNQGGTQLQWGGQNGMD